MLEFSVSAPREVAKDFQAIREACRAGVSQVGQASPDVIEGFFEKNLLFCRSYQDGKIVRHSLTYFLYRSLWVPLVAPGGDVGKTEGIHE